MKVLRKPEVVDAYQFVSANDDIGEETFPAWLVAILGSRVWVEQEDEDTPWSVMTSGGKRIAAIGDWN